MKIEKGIPIPSKNMGGITSILREMEIGDSLFLENRTAVQQSGILGYLKPKKFTQRKVEGGTRIWRIG